MSRRDAPQGPFSIGGIPCMRCDRCGITRELARFWTAGIRSKPKAAQEMLCTHCR